MQDQNKYSWSEAHRQRMGLTAALCWLGKGVDWVPGSK
uniref:Uncharacterized protein n=1 Tax=Anguilla anguilla TaxID=7936 RepID=A0A0E9RN41_ANGAN